MDDDILFAHEVAEMIGCGKKYVVALVSNGSLPRYDGSVCKRKYWLRKSIDLYIRNWKHKKTPVTKDTILKQVMSTGDVLICKSVLAKELGVDHKVINKLMEYGRIPDYTICNESMKIKAWKRQDLIKAGILEH